jgi:hypothetical protein
LLRFSPCRYVIIITPEPKQLLPNLRPHAMQALRARRLILLAGDRGQERYITPETEKVVRRLYNRGVSGAEPADRVRELTVVIHNFFQRSESFNTATVEDRMRTLLRETGYVGSAVQVVRTGAVMEVIAVLEALGHCDPAPAVLPPTTLVEALERFQAKYPKEALVSAAALAQAREFEVKHGSMPNAPGILADLQAVHSIYGRLEDLTGKRIEPRDRAKLLQDAIGQTLASEHATVAENHRRFTIPEWNNRTVECALHLRYNFGYARVYFWFAPFRSDTTAEPIRTVIGHAGEHLLTGGKGDKR